MIENTSPYFLPVAPTGNPPEGFVYVQRTESHFRRSVNGAWLGNGQTTTNFKVPVTEIAGWLSPGSCGYVFLTFPDGSHLSVDGGNTPVVVTALLQRRIPERHLPMSLWSNLTSSESRLQRQTGPLCR